MAEEQSPDFEGKRSLVSRIKDAVRSTGWAKEIAQQFDSSVEKVGEVTEANGIVPVFLDVTAKSEIFSHWHSYGGNEVGGWAVGTEGTHNGHKYLHVTKIIPDSGSGSHGEFLFAGPHAAYDYVRQRRQAGEHLVVIGSVHTHPKGWSGRITGQNRDSSVFASLEALSGGLLSNKRSHIVMTPADNNQIDIWQANDTNEPWDKKLVRNGHFLLKSIKPPEGRVRIVQQASPGRVKIVEKPSRVRIVD